MHKNGRHRCSRSCDGRGAESQRPLGSQTVITTCSRCKRQLASMRRIRDNGAMRRIYRKFQLARQHRVRLTVVVGILSAASRITSLDAASSVSIELQGEIEPECQLKSVSSAIELGSILRSGSKQILFGITCNAPFSFAVTSQSGGLRNVNGTTVRAGFTSFLFIPRAFLSRRMAEQSQEPAQAPRLQPAHLPAASRTPEIKLRSISPAL